MIQSLISGLTSKLSGLISIAQKVAGVIAKVIPGSPVKEGPLRSLNHGHAGGQIIEMLVDGINARRRDLVAAARSVSIPLAAAVNAAPSALVTSPTGGARLGTTTPVPGRVYAPSVVVNNPPPVSGERQVLDALSKVETLYNPLGVLVG